MFINRTLTIPFTVYEIRKHKKFTGMACFLFGRTAKCYDTL